MIFSNGLDDKVRDGTKTQTRRLAKKGDDLVHWPTTSRELELGMRPRRNSVPCLYRLTKSGRDYLLWRETQTYAIQSGPGKKGNGRFRITKIRMEKLQDISWADIRAEGFPPTKAEELGYHVPEGRERFASLWDSIHKKPGDRWDSNPEVWVLEIEPMREDDG